VVGFWEGLSENQKGAPACTWRSPAALRRLFCDGCFRGDDGGFSGGPHSAFALFGGVPTTILYDNTRLAVAKILGDGTRAGRRGAFSELQSHCLFAEKFGRRAKATTRGKVEGIVGYARRNFMVPIPRWAVGREWNERLVEQCRERRTRRLRAGTKRRLENVLRGTGRRFFRCRAARMKPARSNRREVSSLSLVRYRTNDYSGADRYGYRDVLVKGYVHRGVVVCGSEVIGGIREARTAGRGLRPRTIPGFAGAEGHGRWTSSAAGGLGVAGVFPPFAAAARSAAEQGR